MVTKPKIYTRDYVWQETEKLLYKLRNNKNIVYLGELFEDTIYSRNRFHEWAKEFIRDEQISCTIEKIKEILESRVVTYALHKELNPQITKFHLMNNFGWKNIVAITPVAATPHEDKFSELSDFELKQKTKELIEQMRQYSEN